MITNNKNITITVKDLNSENPDMTLGQFLNKLNEKEKIRKEERVKQLNNKLEWYKNLIGRYFILNFNDVSYCVVYIDKLFSGEITTKFLTYDIHRSSEQFSITKENRPINKLWFNCPYEDEYFGKSSTKVKEITKEEFDNYTKLFESQAALFNLLELD